MLYTVLPSGTNALLTLALELMVILYNKSRNLTVNLCLQLDGH